MTAYAGGGEKYEVIETTPEPEEITEPSNPLTPESNATLIDDIWSENKQLITVTTKNGNCFYVLMTVPPRARTPSISLTWWMKPTLWH